MAFFFWWQKIEKNKKKKMNAGKGWTIFFFFFWFSYVFFYSFVTMNFGCIEMVVNQLRLSYIPCWFIRLSVDKMLKRGGEKEWKKKKIHLYQNHQIFSWL